MENSTVFDLRQILRDNNWLNEIKELHAVNRIDKVTKQQIIEFIKNKNYNPINSTQQKPTIQNQSQKSEEIIKPKFNTPLPMQKNDINNQEEIPDFLTNDTQNYSESKNEKPDDDSDNSADYEDEEKMAKDYKLKIDRYIDRFHWLKSCQYNSNEYDYKERLEEIENKLSSYNMSQFLASQFLVMTNIIEQASTKYVPKKYVNLEGYTKHLSSQEALYNVLDEIAIKYSDSDISILSPEKRLGLLMLASAYVVSESNKNKEQMEQENTKINIPSDL